MKRVLEIVALILLVAGVEFSTEAVSHALGRLALAYHGILAGGEPGVSLPRFFAGVGMVVTGAGLLTLDLWARAYARFVGRGKACPNCGGKTERVKRRVRHRVLAWVLGERVTRRKCKTCGWSGLAS